MQTKREIKVLAEHAARRAACNDLKQRILFQWMKAKKPQLLNVNNVGIEESIAQQAIDEMNDTYPQTVFLLGNPTQEYEYRRDARATPIL